MSLNKYIDPENHEEILDRLKKCPTVDGVRLLANEVFPDFIVGVLDQFSTDYPHLTANWLALCKQMKTSPAQIIIVDNFDFTVQHKLVRIFCECFTRAGFVVRKKGEIIPCEVCLRAIPPPHMYTQMKNSGLIVPEEWSSKCMECL